MTGNDKQETSISMVLLTIAFGFAFCFCAAGLFITAYHMRKNEAYTIWVFISATSATAFLIAFYKTSSKLPPEQ